MKHYIRTIEIWHIRGLQMKYRDLITIFLFLVFILSLAFALGVDTFYWFIPVILFVVLVFSYYKLYIEK